MASHDLNVDGHITPIHPQLGAERAQRVRIQNIDTNAILRLREASGVRTPPRIGHKIMPGEWYVCNVGPDNRVYVWTDDPTGCQAIVTEWHPEHNGV